MSSKVLLKKRSKALFIIVTLILINLIVMKPLLNSEVVTVIAPQPATEPIEAIVSGTVVEQSFIAPANRINSIGLLMGTYMRSNIGEIAVEILIDNKVYHSEHIQLEQLVDNDYMTVSFPPVKGVAGKPIGIKITSVKYNTGNEVTIWSADRNVYPDSNLKINGKEVNSALIFQVTKKDMLFQKMIDAISKTGETKAPIIFIFTILLYAMINYLIYYLLRGEVGKNKSFGN